MGLSPSRRPEDQTGVSEHAARSAGCDMEAIIRVMSESVKGFSITPRAPQRSIGSCSGLPVTKPKRMPKRSRNAQAISRPVKPSAD